MATQSEIAALLGISPSSLSKKLSGVSRFTPEECVKLTEIYGEDAPVEAWDKTAIAESLRDKSRTITAQTSEINQYHRGTKIAWICALVYVFTCLVLIAWGLWRPGISYLAARASDGVLVRMWELHEENTRLRRDYDVLDDRLREVEGKQAEIDNRLGVRK